MRLTQVMLFTGDVHRLQAFYVDVLGMAVIDGSADEGFVRLGAGGCTLALHLARGWVAGDGADYPTKLCFHAADVRATRAELMARGAVFGEAREFGDVVICDGRDADGNVIQLTNRP